MDIGESFLHAPEGLTGAMEKFMRSLADLVEEVQGKTFDGFADDDRIRATVDSAGVLQEVDIHVLAKRQHDNLTLSELVLEAISQAQDRAREAQQSWSANITMFGLPLEEATDPAKLMRAMQRSGVDL